MAEIAYSELLRIHRALTEHLRWFTFLDTEGRIWAIIDDELYAGRLRYRTNGRIRYPFARYGRIGGFELNQFYGVDYCVARDMRWRIDVGGVALLFDIKPPYDCRCCRHFIFTDESESGYEGGGWNCRYALDEGDTNYYDYDEGEGRICRSFEADAQSAEVVARLSKGVY